MGMLRTQTLMSIASYSEEVHKKIDLLKLQLRHTKKRPKIWN
jgi:hypothetical protein